MTKMKPLSARDIKDLTNLRVQRGLRLPDLAKELGVGERTLARYFQGTSPRNNEKGWKAYNKLRELLKDFRSTNPKDLPTPKGRKKIVRVAGVFLPDTLVREIHVYMNGEKISYGDMAVRLDISEGHLLSVVRQEDKASLKLRDAIVDLVTKQSEPLQSIEDVFRLSEKTAENLKVGDVVATVISTDAEQQPLDLYTSPSDSDRIHINIRHNRPADVEDIKSLYHTDVLTELEVSAILRGAEKNGVPLTALSEIFGLTKLSMKEVLNRDVIPTKDLYNRLTNFVKSAPLEKPVLSPHIFVRSNPAPALEISDHTGLGEFPLTTPKPSVETKSISSTYTHTLRLRSDFAVNIELPIDLSLEEAGRLSAFIQLIVLD